MNVCTPARNASEVERVEKPGFPACATVEALKSMPAQNASPLPVSRTARTSGSARNSRTASMIPSRISIVSALRASGPIELDAADAVVTPLDDQHRRPQASLFVRMLTTDTPEPRPPALCCSANPLRISTCRSPAAPRSCHQHSVSWATPVAPIG